MTGKTEHTHMEERKEMKGNNQGRKEESKTRNKGERKGEKVMWLLVTLV